MHFYIFSWSERKKVFAVASITKEKLNYLGCTLECDCKILIKTRLKSFWCCKVKYKIRALIVDSKQERIVSCGP